MSKCAGVRTSSRPRQKHSRSVDLHTKLSLYTCVYIIGVQETKSQLATTAKKLKQAQEEGEQIRSDLKTMITQYQVPTHLLTTPQAMSVC